MMFDWLFNLIWHFDPRRKIWEPQIQAMAADFQREDLRHQRQFIDELRPLLDEAKRRDAEAL